MLCKSCLCRIVLCLLTGLGSGYNACAQDTSRAERYFKELDRDNSGSLSEEEVRRADDRIQERMEAAGLKLRPGLNQSDFAKFAEKVDEARQKERESRGDGDRGMSSKPKEKQKVNVALPTTYVATDKDGDGQIGLYEWERAKFAEFRALDRNGDGFLSPRELIAGNTFAATPASTTTAPGSVAPPPAVNPAAPGTPAVATPPVTSAAPVATTPPEEDRDAKLAKVYFKGLDKNSDGTITEDEWSESRGIRVKFEQAEVTPPFPLTEDEFIKQYRTVEQKKATST